jgi:thioredoxin-dependent peroxiredoxin
MAVDIDQPVADFEAPATNGQTVSLASLKGKQVVIYFYPKDSTPGCTTQGQGFRDQHEAFKAANTEVFGVSRDSLKSHENFKAKQAFTFELISDKEEALCQLFDVIKLKKLYGKEYMGVDRSTFLIDKEGVLRQEWRGVNLPPSRASPLPQGPHSSCGSGLARDKRLILTEESCVNIKAAAPPPAPCAATHPARP